MGNRKQLTGTVLSSKMHKTIIVKVTRIAKHPKYGKIMKRYNKFKVHDEKNSAQAGDIVRIVQTRPLSKEKRFRLLEVVKKAASSVEIKEELV